MDCHLIKQVEQGVQVVTVVEHRLVHRFADGLACGKVDDTLDAGIVGEKLIKSLDVCAVGFYKIRTDACDTLDAIKHIFI